MRVAALPNFFSSKTSWRYSAASSFELTITTPLPAASPSIFSTAGNFVFFSASSASSAELHAVASGVGMLYFRMNSLEKTFEPSSSAARRGGSHNGRARLWESSAKPGGHRSVGAAEGQVLLRWFPEKGRP